MVYVFVHHFGYFIVSPDPDRTYADSGPVAAASLNRITAAGKQKSKSDQSKTQLCLEESSFSNRNKTLIYIRLSCYCSNYQRLFH